MNCKKHNGEYFWSLDPEENTDETCPDHSVPWRLDALCSVKTDEKCYETTFGNDKVAVCVITDDTSELSACAYDYLNQDIKIANDHVINDPAYFDDMIECSLQDFGQMQSAKLKTYVPKNREDVCEQILDEANNACKGMSNCTYEAEKLIDDSPTTSFECVIDTRNIPKAAGKPTWWQWHRVNEYECKDDGWRCDDRSLNEYKGGAKCFMKDDCHSNAEYGMCVNQKCTVGSALGSNCQTDEDCDVLQNIEGSCNEGDKKCNKGKNGLHISYYKPKECSDDDKKYAHSLHNYCGETTDEYGGEKYTGYCANIEGTSKKVCKAMSSKEVESIRHEEENYLQGIRHHHNFYSQKPPWENLIQCPQKDRVVVNGHELCYPTVEKISVELGKVHAHDIDSAGQKCSARFNLPHVVLPSI
jgi:hypothetical protein